ncbi:hypothetical protein GQ457_03G023640 [Hibiscus cannabinus]
MFTQIFLDLYIQVIGPYRSGKFSLLNQLLSLSCDEVEYKLLFFYLDTKDFQSVGKSNVYDDRIFALTTVMSSVLIYNLPRKLPYLKAEKASVFSFNPSNSA